MKITYYILIHFHNGFSMLSTIVPFIPKRQNLWQSRSYAIVSNITYLNIARPQQDSINSFGKSFFPTL
jgi:hypothetical protein